VGAVVVTLVVVAAAAAAARAQARLVYRPVVLVQLPVADLDRAIAFYRDVLELAVTERRDDLGFAHIETRVPGLQIGLSAGGSLSGSGGSIVNIGVADVAASRALLESRGVVFTGATQVIPGKVSLAAFADPDGNRLRLAGPAPAREGEAAATAYVRDLVTRLGIPGLQAAVAIDGRLAWSANLGVADVERSVPVTSDTRFRVGSISKLFTAAALARLVEEGKIDPAADVRAYVPAFPAKPHAITIAQLAGHLSGLRSYRGAEFVSRARYASVIDAVGVFAEDPLLFDPGAKYAYSTYNYTLLSAAIEAAAARPFLSHMRDAIFAPLGMGATVPDQAEQIITRRAMPYERAANGRLEHAPFVDVSNKWAGGGYLSTASDLVTFGLAHSGPGFHKPETLERMFTTMRVASGEPTGVGYAWRLGVDAAGVRYAHHGGEAMGARAFLLIVPERRAAVAILTNLGRAAIDEKDALQLIELVARK
jgi:CubicO group peptidase (beta-lactamase class C family)